MRVDCGSQFIGNLDFLSIVLSNLEFKHVISASSMLCNNSIFHLVRSMGKCFMATVTRMRPPSSRAPHPKSKSSLSGIQTLYPPVSCFCKPISTATAAYNSSMGKFPSIVIPFKIQQRELL